MTVRTAALVALATLALAACHTAPRPVADAAPERGAGPVVVAPLNVSIRAPQELEGRAGPVWRELVRYFERYDRPVALLAPARAEALWAEAQAGLSLADRPAALEAARARFAEGLAQQVDYDLLVVASLVLRPARLQGTHAAWDGVERAVPGGAQLVSGASRFSDAMWPTDAAFVKGLRGEIAAASLHVAVLSRNGVLVHEGVGGLDVIQEARRDPLREGAWELALRANPFADAGHLRDGLERAFERPLPRAALAR